MSLRSDNVDKIKQWFNVPIGNLLKELKFL